MNGPKLWAVSQGERHEGQSLVSLHLRLDTAMAAALKLAARSNRAVGADDFVQVGVGDSWAYEHGCDVTRVEAVEVLP